MKARNKCLRCKKKFKRKSERKSLQKKPYDGNMICYRVKKNPVVDYTYLPPANATAEERGKMSLEQREGKTYYKSNEFTYDYILWDGQSYESVGGFFCTKDCASPFAIKVAPKFA